MSKDGLKGKELWVTQSFPFLYAINITSEWLANTRQWQEGKRIWLGLLVNRELRMSVPSFWAWSKFWFKWKRSLLGLAAPPGARSCTYHAHLVFLWLPKPHVLLGPGIPFSIEWSIHGASHHWWGITNTAGRWAQTYLTKNKLRDKIIKTFLMITAEH